MKTRRIFTLCLCAALLFGAFQTGVSAETESDRTNRRDPFDPLFGVSSGGGDTGTPVPSGRQDTVLQQHALKEFQVIGIVLGELGHHAVVLAPDGKRYMISKGTPIGQYDGTVTDITPNSIQVTEIFHIEKRNGDISAKEVENTLFLDPLKPSRTPETRFVVLSE